MWPVTAVSAANDFQLYQITGTVDSGTTFDFTATDLMGQCKWSLFQ